MPKRPLFAFMLLAVISTFPSYGRVESDAEAMEALERVLARYEIPDFSTMERPSGNGTIPTWISRAILIAGALAGTAALFVALRRRGLQSTHRVRTMNVGEEAGDERGDEIDELDRAAALLDGGTSSGVPSLLHAYLIDLLQERGSLPRGKYQTHRRIVHGSRLPRAERDLVARSGGLAEYERFAHKPVSTTECRSLLKDIGAFERGSS